MGAGGLVSPPSFSPDGRFLAYGVWAEGKGGALRGAVCVFDNESGAAFPVPLPANSEGFWPVWSPRGAVLAMLRRGGDRWEIALYDHQLGQARRLYRAPPGAVLGPHLAWRADGAALLANQRAAAGNYQVIRIDTATGRAVRLGEGLFGWPLDATRTLWLTTRAPDYKIDFDRPAAIVIDGIPVHDACEGVPYAPAPAPDGSRVAFWRIDDDNGNGRFDPLADAARLVVLSLDADKQVIIAATGQLQYNFSGMPQWDDAGKNLTYLMFDATSELQWATWRCTVQQQGSSTAKLLEGAAAVAWHPENSSWAYTEITRRGKPRTVWVVGAEVREMTSCP